LGRKEGGRVHVGKNRCLYFFVGREAFPLHQKGEREGKEHPLCHPWLLFIKEVPFIAALLSENGKGNLADWERQEQSSSLRRFEDRKGGI